MNTIKEYYVLMDTFKDYYGLMDTIIGTILRIAYWLEYWNLVLVCLWISIAHYKYTLAHANAITNYGLMNTINEYYYLIDVEWWVFEV